MCRNVRMQKPDLLDHLNRELGRLFSAQDLINVRRRLLSYYNKIGSNGRWRLAAPIVRVRATEALAPTLLRHRPKWESRCCTAF
jgi:hypothetical protein